MPKKTFPAVAIGERTNSHGKPISNKILLSLPDQEFRAIRAHLEFAKWDRHKSLYEPNHRIKFAYFPNCGLVSLVILMEDGRKVELHLDDASTRTLGSSISLPLIARANPHPRRSSAAQPQNGIDPKGALFRRRSVRVEFRSLHVVHPRSGAGRENSEPRAVEQA